MPLSNEELLWKSLSLINASSSPVGAWKLARLLYPDGIHISEATAGRLLRLLEDRGFLTSNGHVGRVITPLGQKALLEWEEKQQRTRSHRVFLESLKIQHPEELIDVLVARRAIETETAALAAIHATEDDIKTLQEIIAEHDRLLAQGSSGVEKDAEFHRALARAGKNRILAAALDVIYNDPDIGKALEFIRSEVGSRMVMDHRSILKEIEARKPERARRAMERHIANVIRDVEKYWSKASARKEGDQGDG